MVVLLSVSAKARVVSATLHRMRVRTTVPTRTIISPSEIYLGKVAKRDLLVATTFTGLYMGLTKRPRKIARRPFQGLMVEFVCTGRTKTRASFDSTVSAGRTVRR